MDERLGASARVTVGTRFGSTVRERSRRSRTAEESIVEDPHGVGHGQGVVGVGVARLGARPGRSTEEQVVEDPDTVRDIEAEVGVAVAAEERGVGHREERHGPVDEAGVEAETGDDHHHKHILARIGRVRESTQRTCPH